MKKLLFDVTNFDSAMTFVCKYTGLTKVALKRYIKTTKYIDTKSFIEHFEINVDKFFDYDIWLTSLHITTNNDDCASLKKLGIINLQRAIEEDTPFSRYLKLKGIRVDLHSKLIKYKTKEYSLDDALIENVFYTIQQQLKFTIRKLYRDYQINGFFCGRNILEYGGQVSHRPEILNEFSRLFDDRDIQYDYVKQENMKCYVVKFKAPINDYEWYSLTDDVSKELFFSLDESRQERIKRIGILKIALGIISSFNCDGSLPKEVFSYLKFDAVVPLENFIQIYSADVFEHNFCEKR